RALAGADLVTVAVPVDGGDGLVIEAADGEGAGRVRGLVLPPVTLAARVYRRNARTACAVLSEESQGGGGSAGRIELGPGFLLPLGGHQEHAR
ncbi:histidine kinase, partial [Streptomyces sp. TRM76130]|nr:histidine kinase [Streptomyces sp. TRM76130]